MKPLRDDPLPDPTIVSANWLALAVFGREKRDPAARSGHTMHGVELSNRSMALLFAEPSWLLALADKNI